MKESGFRPVVLYFAELSELSAFASSCLGCLLKQLATLAERIEIYSMHLGYFIKEHMTLTL